MTVGVYATGNDPHNRSTIIVDSAPIVRKFRGQPLANLIGWMQRQGKLRLVYVGEKDEQA